MRSFWDVPKEGRPIACQTADAMVIPVSKVPEGRATGTGGMKTATTGTTGT